MIHSIVVYGYEDHIEILLSADVTPEQFKRDVDKAVKQVGVEYIGKSDFWIGTTYWLHAAAKWLYEHGYERVEVDKYYFIDHAILDGDQGEEEWHELVGEELYSMALAANGKIQEDLEKDL